MYPIGIHIPEIPVILQKLDTLAEQIAELQEQGVRHMAEVTDQVREVLTAIDTATTELAVRVEALIAKAVDSMDQGEADPLLAEARAIAARLRGIAADPTNPVPGTEPASAA